MVTFKVDNVKIPSNKLGSHYDGLGFGNEQRQKYDLGYLKKIFNPALESHSLELGKVYLGCGSHPLVETMDKAYANHYPLVISPDHLWILISTQLAKHIELNAEKLRHHFVNFDGKKEIRVYENSFVKGQQNNWAHFFGELTKGVEGYIGPKKNLLVSNFSTTTPLAKTISEITLLDSMKQYFTYVCMTMCGIPEITLTGTKEDWVDIKRRIQMLSEFDLEWWVDQVIPLIDHFISAFDDKVNRDFWSNIYKSVDIGSGSPTISGWFRNFFMYDGRNNMNTFQSNFLDTSTQFPSSLSKAPFTWEYYDQVFEMEFAGGFVGYSQNDDLSIQCELAWGVYELDAYLDRKIEYHTFDGSDQWRQNYDRKQSLSTDLKNFGCEIMSSWSGTFEIRFPKSALPQVKAWKEEKVKEGIVLP